MLGVVRSLIHSENKAGLVTLHDPSLAIEYCDYLVLIRDGKVIADLRADSVCPSEIKVCLSQIYGEITVLEHEDRYVVLSD